MVISKAIGSRKKMEAAENIEAVENQRRKLKNENK